MKQETNNEMDLLLRRLGRRDDATVSDAAGDHLDPDELSAYAENALPVAARTRYTAHLAECLVCRGLVVQLSSSAGVVMATESAKVSPPSAFRKFLASLFTPMVLRYAAPALGLIIVGAIGFVIMRRQQSPQYVTQVNDAGQKPAAVPSPESGFLTYDSTEKTQPTPPRGAVAGDAKNPPRDATPVPNAAPAVASVEAEASKNKPAEQPKAEEQAKITANEPAPPQPTPTPTPVQNPATVETDASKKDVKESPAAGRVAERTLQAERRDDREKDNFARARRSEDTVRAPARAAGAGLQSGSADSSANTRTVAGRRFRKEDGVWIDTAYAAGKDATALTRGSEQFRALVADEPAIKTIADTLDGEIIVVWKGRTYRIR
jgi:hypothetical protein